MKKIARYAVIGMIGMLFAACGDDIVEAEPTVPVTYTESGVRMLTAAKAYEIMQGDEPYVILDVRTKEEYNEGHIEGAILIPNEDIDTKYPELLPVPDAQILVYCRSGNRSAQAAEKLIKMGYTNVSDFGGINDWTYGTVQTAWDDKAGTYASFRTVDINGVFCDESIYAKTKLTMVNIWATFCGPCIREMPELNELNEELEDFQVVGIVIDTADYKGNIDWSQIEYARTIAEQTGAAYTHLLPSDDLMNAGLNYIYSVPTTFFVDSKGNTVGETYVGSRDKDSWTEIIEQTMKGMK